MEYKIKVGVSNRHVHLTKEDYELLFDEELTIKYKLNQIGEFASNQTLTLKSDNGVIENVRVVGPLRKYTQVEISRRDARNLKVNPPVRSSGDVIGSESITLETPKASITRSACIIADRHVHMSPDDAIKYDVVNNQGVKIKVNGDKSGIMDAVIKVGDTGYYEFHIDTDDANAFNLDNGDEVTLII